ncbi:uncharacterized protein UTRI_00135_B [Ustilago trichophora]|uniref:Multiple myeloma tumor-associated protein 2-like N-terminal domain-containing protein n=1 Tax=Ustilago trichophora TaxID=86804 RepID=A0A5C3DP36_9BASI|nr:uncharacterized protein UTRI_00135_B [Ustilago trichophora]
MHHPTRGGARGGAAEFSWDKVKESKDREFYLGNSVAAPTGRWQDGRDINWYNKDKSASGSSPSAIDERREELRKIKEAETAALYAKLGKPPPPTGGEGEMKVGDRLASGSAGSVKREVTGANGAPLDGAKSRWGKGVDGEDEISEADKKLARRFARDEVRRRRAEAGAVIRAEDTTMTTRIGTGTAGIDTTITANRGGIETMIATTRTQDGTVTKARGEAVEVEVGRQNPLTTTDIEIAMNNVTNRGARHPGRSESIGRKAFDASRLLSAITSVSMFTLVIDLIVTDPDVHNRIQLRTLILHQQSDAALPSFLTSCRALSPLASSIQDLIPRT